MFYCCHDELFILSIIYCMSIASCRLTPRMALKERLLSHLSTVNSLYLRFKYVQSITTYREKQTKITMNVSYVGVYTETKHLCAACIK